MEGRGRDPALRPSQPEGHRLLHSPPGVDTCQRGSAATRSGHRGGRGRHWRQSELPPGNAPVTLKARSYALMEPRVGTSVGTSLEARFVVS
jgi:hypothetical protein